MHAIQREQFKKYLSLWVPALICGFACKTASFGAELQVCMGPRPHLSCYECKTVWLASELLFSRGPSPRLWFWMQNSDFWTRITSLYRYQTSPVVLCMQISVISTRIKSLYGPQTSPVVWYMQNSVTLAHELLVSMGSCPHLWFLDAKQRLLDWINKSLWVPDIACRFVH